MIIKYNKLVRDRIPEIIEKDGEKTFITTLPEGCEFLIWVKRKILEEAEELAKTESKKEALNEMVDIQDLIDTLLTGMDVSKLEFWTLRREKNQERGGFKRRLFLIKTKK
jgi:predicted house-cleaning noncanonical NTP pyrophosphatase (MazG superfamily)